MIAKTATTKIKIMMPIRPRNFAILPNTIPTTKKSVSENVVAAPPKSPKKGKNSNGKNVINNPFKADPATAPLIPPLALPKTPAVAPQQNSATSPGSITTTPNKNKRNMAFTPTIQLP